MSISDKKAKLAVLLIFASIIGVAYWVSVSTTHHNPPQPTVDKPSVYSLWVDTNEERAKAGLAPLELDPELNASADAKCDDMVANNYWEHKGPDGRRARDYILDTEGQVFSKWGENLSANGASTEDVISGWMGSSGHRSAILDSEYNHVGYAVCDNATYKNIVVQHFTAE